MNEYIIFLPNEKAKTYRLVTVIVFLINLFAFLFLLTRVTDDHMKRIIWMGNIMSAASLIFFLINVYLKRLSFRTEISFLIIAICWIMLGKYLVAAFIILFAIAGFFTTRKLKVIFSADKIVYPSFPATTFLWNQVSNVVLKDSVLTIDLKTNKLIQVVIEEGADEVEEEEFNRFCQEQTAKLERR